MKDESQNDYLWDRSGPRDLEIARLEDVLGTLRLQRPAPAPPRRAPARRAYSIGLRALTVAAAHVVAVAGVWFALGFWRTGWTVESVEGRPVVDGERISDAARLRIGGWLTTDAASRARMEVGSIGRVDVFPNTRVQLVEAKGREHRLALDRGTIHARIWAPPKIFYVNTPAAVAVDLGCEYTLQVDDTGAGLLRVTQGWVAFETDGRESFIPQGAMCETRPGIGPGTPRYEDAPSGYGEALKTLDFGSADAAARTAAFDVVLSRARRRDALTLWHLVASTTAEERARVVDRLAELAPPPPHVSREAVMRGDRDHLALWWDALGLDTGSWWKIFKKKF